MEQDSLEDYINLSRSKEEPKNEEIRVQSLVATLQKKRESEGRAIKIVELLMEGTARPETFCKSIAYINSTYYQDIIEERAITKLCGYPLCGKKIKPLQQKRYSISTKNNKVYDLNEYGNFCSIYCYNASNHIQNQIDDSPLWLREFVDTPTINILSKKIGNSSKGVDLKSTMPNKEDIFTPVASFATMSLDDFINFEVDKTLNKKKHFKLPTVVENEQELSRESKTFKKIYKTKLETLVENALDEMNANKNDRIENILEFKETLNELEVPTQYLTTPSLNKKGAETVLRSEYQIESEGNVDKLECAVGIENNSFDEQIKLQIIMNKNIKTSKIQCIPPLPVQAKPDLCNTQPKAKDLRALNEKIKSKFAKPLVPMIEPLPLYSETYGVRKMNEQRISLLKNNEMKSKLRDQSLIKLKFTLKNSTEIEGQIRRAFRTWISLDTLILIHGENKIKEILDKNKLSDYFDNLKVAQLEVTQQKKYVDICKKLHVQELLEEKWDKSCTGSNKLKALQDYSELKAQTKELDVKVKTFYGGMLYEADDSNFPIKETKEKGEEDVGVPAVLPLVDVNSQNALRRRVLLDSLNKGVKFFLEIIKYNSVAVLADLQDLVKTFKLSANNIVFKPIIWNYLAFICLKILALRDQELEEILKTEEAVELQNLILEQLPGKNGIVSSCLELIKYIDIFIENYVSR